MTKLLTPSTTDLNNMIKAAEAKFAADREQCLSERAMRAFHANAQKINAERAHDMRRRVFAGARP